MRFDPSLRVVRLVIEANGKSVYDENFHRGLNIVRGENSSGKSTILNFLFYGLGGDLTAWSEAAQICSRVTVEVELSGKRATISREVSSTPGRAMDIFGGPYDLALRAPRAEWTRYLYARSTGRESFSQTLFRLLGLPEVRNESNNVSITVHQVLRLLYADQLSPIDELFRAERFDSALTRDIVGRLLCGAYDLQLYNDELRLRDLERQFLEVSAQLRSLLAVGGRVGEAITPGWVAAERQKVEQERHLTQAEIERAERALFAARDDKGASLDAQNGAYTEVQRLQASIIVKRNLVDSLAMEVADSAVFITNLERRLDALRDASLIAKTFDGPRFQSCPSCYAPIADKHEPDVCHLCKSPFDTERARQRVAALINDTALQLRQSRGLQERRIDKLQSAEAELSNIETQWQTASARLREVSRVASTKGQDSLRQLQRKAGYLDRQLEELDQRARVAEMVSRMSAQKETIGGEIGRLKTRIETTRLSQQDRMERAKQRIADAVLDLIRHDLKREARFESAERVDFDFASNRLAVDGSTYFSASSRAFLRSAFTAGMLFAAAGDPLFRHPRFCMIDTVEDKGMEPDRSRNLQLLLAERSRNAKSDHQIIIATAMIAPELDDEKYTVGRFSTRYQPSLAGI
jgi:hypothetical protein